MIKLMKTTSLATLIVLFSGCTNVLDNMIPESKPRINETLEVVNYSSIKSIPDRKSVV